MRIIQSEDELRKLKINYAKWQPIGVRFALTIMTVDVTIVALTIMTVDVTIVALTIMTVDVTIVALTIMTADVTIVVFVNVNSSKLIIDVYMSPCTVLLLILEFLPARLATLPYGLDSNITQLLATLLTKPSVFIILPIVSCNLVSIKIIILLLLLLTIMPVAVTIVVLT